MMQLRPKQKKISTLKLEVFPTLSRLMPADIRDPLEVGSGGTVPLAQED